MPVFSIFAKFGKCDRVLLNMRPHAIMEEL